MCKKQKKKKERLNGTHQKKMLFKRHHEEINTQLQRGKIFTTYLSNKGLASRMSKYSIKSIIKRRTLQLKEQEKT